MNPNLVDIYERLMDLYEKDPVEFEKEAGFIIDKAIDAMCERATEEDARRIRAMQWRINTELRKYKDPIARMNKMIEMFWDGVNKFNEIV